MSFKKKKINNMKNSFITLLGIFLFLGISFCLNIQNCSQLINLSNAEDHTLDNNIGLFNFLKI
jgi:hypothetical protein